MHSKVQSQRNFEENEPESRYVSSGKRCSIQRRCLSLAAGEQILQQNASRRLYRQASVDETSEDVVGSCKYQPNTTASSAVMAKLRNFRRQLYIHVLESAALSNDLSRALPRDTVCDLYFGDLGTTSPRPSTTVQPFHQSVLRKTSKSINDPTDSVRKQMSGAICGNSPIHKIRACASRKCHSHTQSDQFSITSLASGPCEGKRAMRSVSVCDNKCLSRIETTPSSVASSRPKSFSDDAYIQKCIKKQYTCVEDKSKSVRTFLGEMQEEPEALVSSNAPTCHQRHHQKKKSHSKFREIEYDEGGRTCEVYGAEQDASALGKAIEAHLEHLMQKTQDKQKACNSLDNLNPDERTSGQSSPAQLPCKEQLSGRRTNQKRVAFQKRAVSHAQHAGNVSQSDEDEHIEHHGHKGKMLSRINRLLHRSFASTSKDHTVPSDLQTFSPIDGVRPKDEIGSVPMKCTLSSVPPATASNTDKILVFASS
ncbi:unnamed protein product [Dibothriocephalus latus]|uniref:G protein-regulated inducer of neurite outgrowth C-terminal domain-containing protein n=1 Tax=Dibothriocephalus latus TaxID=60516 RepID=A0A3P7NLQ4_DIBLA|nr:unnamed protein product [Dibothriocephalus latus]